MTGTLSLKQHFYSAMCKILAGDKYEERATNLLPDEKRIKGLRLATYKLFSSLRYKEGMRLAKKFGTNSFKPHWLIRQFKKPDIIESEEYIHEYFELSYAHYLVLPRTLLQSMPPEWQKQFVKLLEEFEERFTAFEWLPEGTNYNVQLKDRKGKIHSINEDIFNDYEKGRRIIEEYVVDDPVNGKHFDEDYRYIGKVVIRNGCKEWYCKHGVGHYVEKINPNASTVHGCDGCCNNKKMVKRALENTPNPKKEFSF